MSKYGKQIVGGVLPLFVLLICVCTSDLKAQVFLDFDEFDDRLNELASAVGITSFSAAEISGIQSTIESSLESSFADFSGITFSDVDPGGVRSELIFGDIGGGLGVAQHIDFLNRDLNDTAFVFSGNFGFIVDEFSGSTQRADQIMQLSAAISGTAAHELGHNLGLRHHDAHGNLVFEGATINTGGDEDLRLLSTGSTGLSEMQREQTRDFSINSQVKLAYANTSIVSGNPTALLEDGDAGDTLATAQAITFEEIPVADRFGEVIIGELEVDADVDLFEVQLVGGSQFTIDVNNDFSSGFNNDPVDTVISLLDDSGNVLFTNDDTLYSATEFGTGTLRSTDSVLYNVGIVDTGTYFVQIESFGASDSGDYQLLLHSDQLFAIPEPTGGLLILGALGCVAARRRRRRS